jgi:hypothetical protein
MSAEEFCTTCIEILLDLPDGMKTKTLVETACVPPAIQTAVILQVLASSLISSSQTLCVKHAWHAKIAKLKIDAFDEISLCNWISANIHVDPLHFKSFIQSNCEKLGVHFRTPTTVRVSTTLNAYDRASLLVAINKAGFGGILRESALAEYRNSYLDLLNLQESGEIYASDECVWYVGNLKL